MMEGSDVAYPSVRLPGQYPIPVAENPYSAPENCFRTEDPSLILAARQLVARTYLRWGFITPDNIGEDGAIRDDPYAEQRTYYVKMSSDGTQVAATVSLIEHAPEKGQKSFPVMEHKDELDPDYIKLLDNLGYENIVEVSTLVRDKELDPNGTAGNEIYKKIFLDAWQRDVDGNSAFIMACNPGLFKKFNLLFGDEMHRIGPDLPYEGQDAVPALFLNREGAVGVIHASKNRRNPYRDVQKAVVDYFFDGASAEGLHPDVLDALEEEGYDDLLSKLQGGDWGPTRENPEIDTVNKIKRAAIVGRARELERKYRGGNIYAVSLLAITAIRTAIVASFITPVSDVNTGLFLAIEVVTTPQIAYPTAEVMHQADDPAYSTSRKRVMQLLIGSGVVAPYVYLGAEGALSSTQGVTACASLAGVAVLPKVVKAVKGSDVYKKAQAVISEYGDKQASKPARRTKRS